MSVYETPTVKKLMVVRKIALIFGFWK